MSHYSSIYLPAHLSIDLSLSVSKPRCIPTCLSVHLLLYLAFCAYVRLSVDLAAFLPTHLAIYLYIYLPICLLIYLAIYVCMPVHTYQCMSAHASINTGDLILACYCYVQDSTGLLQHSSVARAADTGKRTIPIDGTRHNQKIDLSTRLYALCIHRSSSWTSPKQNT